jgi:putative intracellular protease/amidase
MNAEILLFDGFEELDAMGPWQVLARLAGVSDDLTARLVTLRVRVRSRRTAAR